MSFWLRRVILPIWWEDLALDRHVMRVGMLWGKPLGSFQIVRDVASSLESIAAIDVGESDTRQCVCMILELAPYRRRRCFTPDGRGWLGLLY